MTSYRTQLPRDWRLEIKAMQVRFLLEVWADLRHGPHIRKVGPTYLQGPRALLMAVPKPVSCWFCSGSHEPDPDLQLHSNQPEVAELPREFPSLTKAGSEASWHTAPAHSAVGNSYPGCSGRSGGAAGFVLAPSPPRGHVLTISRWFQRLSSKEALAGISAHSARAAAYAHTCSKFHSFQRVSVQGFFALSFFGKLKLSGQPQSWLLQRLRGFSNGFPVAAPHPRFLAIPVRLWRRIKLFPSSRNYNKENHNLERS